MKNTYNFQEYDLITYLDKKKHNNLIFILFLIGIIIIIYSFNFYMYDKELLIKDNDHYKLILPSTKIDDLVNNKYIYINNKKYKYKIKEIDNDFQNINGTIYQSISLDINYKSKSNIKDVYFLKYKKSLYHMIIDTIRGG